MNTIYHYQTFSSTLRLANEAVGPVDRNGVRHVIAVDSTRASVSIVQNVYVYSNAHIIYPNGTVAVGNTSTSNWNGHMDALLNDLARLAVSGRLVVVREVIGDSVFNIPPARYIVTPGRVDVSVAEIAWHRVA